MLSPLPLSYCTNVHPGRTLAEVGDGLRRFAAPVGRALGEPPAAGLWMTDAALAELADPAAVARLRHWLGEAELTCHTFNAFPVGDFHAQRVKDDVYRPDWTERRRLDATIRVADVLAELLPEDTDGSISTVPLAYKAHHPGDRPLSAYCPHLIAVAEHLAAVRRRTGKTIRLAVEPEPLCMLETTAETVTFFDTLRDRAAAAGAADLVDEHLGVCLDVCHQAVEFEDLAWSVRTLDGHGVRINKVHLTHAVVLPDPTDAEARGQLAAFAEPRYLHQSFRRDGAGTAFREDLTADFARTPPADWLAGEWRIHFHVPVSETELGRLRTTRADLSAALAAVAKLPYAPHLEVETYTWPVLPGRDDQTDPEERLRAGLLAELRAAADLIAAAEAQQ